MNHKKSAFTKSELERYSRHLVLPEIGLEGQKKLKNAKVLIIGIGGLGSPLGLYLSAAGVGKLGLLDFDKISSSNLHRQVLFTTHDIGKSKALVAEQKLKSLNPEIEIKSYNLQLTTDNALGIFEGYDIIADGSDNFQTRYLVNDACVLLQKPNVYGSILRFEGQVSVYLPSNSPGVYPAEGGKGGQGDGCPCYRCLYPEPPSPGSIPSCEEGGVLGVLPGIIGSIQANEVIKLIIGKGELLTGRLLIVDALNMKFKELTFEQNPNCPVCNSVILSEAKNPLNENTDLRARLGGRGGYPLGHPINETQESSCRSREGGNPEKNQKRELAPLLEIKTMEQNNHEISPRQLKQKLDDNEKIFLLDVREPFEKEIADIGGVLIPMNSLPSRLGELSKEDEIIVYCHVGGRSQYAAQWLRSRGFKAKNLSGGINAWSEIIDSTIPKY